MSERKLFLASSGIQPETYPFLLKLIGNSPNRTAVGFVSTPSNKPNDELRNRETLGSLESYGFYRVLPIDLGRHDPRSLGRVLDKLDMIYVNSGNTFDLLDWVRRSGLDRLLQNRDYEHIIYCGSSAGSLVAGPNIELAGWNPYRDRNQTQLKNLRGIGIVSFAIAPHCTPPHTDRVVTQYQSANYPIVAITDKQAVIVNMKGFAIAGEGEAKIFNEQTRRLGLQKQSQYSNYPRYSRHSQGFHKQVHASSSIR